MLPWTASRRILRGRMSGVLSLRLCHKVLPSCSCSTWRFAALASRRWSTTATTTTSSRRNMATVMSRNDDDDDDATGIHSHHHNNDNENDNTDAAQSSRAWVNQAMRRIEADFQRSADTHLIKLDIPALQDAQIDLYLKDESTHPTGSLKHRLARSLFLYGLCNGWITRDTAAIVEASSGSTAISDARLLGLPFFAVVPACTSKRKIAQIEFYGGQAHFVDRADQMYEASKQLAADLGTGHFMDQFTYAERATDWRSNNNIATSIFQQMRHERYPIPTWIVMSAGTGGTSATIGRYIRYQGHATQLLVVDPEYSVFYDAYHKKNDDNHHDNVKSSGNGRIEGIGRPRVEPSFVPTVIDRMERVPDVASIATMQWLSTVLGRKVGPSTGTNVYGALQLANEMMQASPRQPHSGSGGSIVTLICDSGERYLDTYYNDTWVKQHIGDTGPSLAYLREFFG